MQTSYRLYKKLFIKYKSFEKIKSYFYNYIVYNFILINEK